MKKYILLFCVFFVIKTVTGQEIPFYNNYYYDKTFINSATCGSTNHYPLTLTDSHKWYGMQGAPYSQTLSFNGRIENNGLGAAVFNDKNGFISTAGGQFTYAYHLIINKRKRIRRSSGKVNQIIYPTLAFGASLATYQFNISQLDMLKKQENYTTTFDPAINSGTSTANVPDASFGIYIYSSSFFVGLSATQLFEMPVKLYDRNIEENNLQRNYFLLAGYNSKVNEFIAFEPSLMVRVTEDERYRSDFNFKVVYFDDYWFMVNYSRNMLSKQGQNNSVKFITQIKIVKGLKFGYAFEYMFNEMQSYTYGSHEAMLGYDFGKQNDTRRKKHKRRKRHRR